MGKIKGLRGRPRVKNPKNEKIVISLSKLDRERLDKRANELGVSLSELVRDAFNQYLGVLSGE